MSNQWILPLKDGSHVFIPEDKIQDINKKLESRQPIKAADRTILFQDIESGPKRYIEPEADPDLAQAAAIAFNEPMLDDDGNVKCVWVKQSVSTDRWNKYYSNFSNYYKLGKKYEKVVIAYRLPVHMWTTDVEKCIPTEITDLENRLATA